MPVLREAAEEASGLRPTVVTFSSKPLMLSESENAGTVSGPGQMAAPEGHSFFLSILSPLQRFRFVAFSPQIAHG